MMFSPTEARDLEAFLRALPERARDDERAICVFAALYAELRNLPASHVVRRIGEQVPR